MSRRHNIYCALVLASMLVSACRAAGDDLATHQHDLEERLLSPCCWKQTLADHQSPVATALRAEIHQRLARETAASIEGDLVHRYGDKIRALPEGGDPRWIIGVTLVGASVLGLLAIGAFVRRRRVPDVAAPSSGALLLEGEYAERLDEELLAVD
jgi:cytochrome c-type biogenesis protein CcmH/NrfF